jgi:HEAT repeat protein
MASRSSIRRKLTWIALVVLVVGTCLYVALQRHETSSRSEYRESVQKKIEARMRDALGTKDEGLLWTSEERREYAGEDSSAVSDRYDRIQFDRGLGGDPLLLEKSMAVTDALLGSRKESVLLETLRVTMFIAALWLLVMILYLPYRILVQRVSMSRMTRSQKKATFAAAAVAAIALAGALWAPITEQWYLWQLDSDELETSAAAATRLADIRSTRAVSPLLEMLRERSDHSDNDYIRESLVAIGAPAVQGLVLALQDPDSKFRFKTLSVLHRMGSVAKDSVPTIIRLLKRDDTQMVRWRAANALESVGLSMPQVASQALLKTLQQEKDANVRGVIAISLGKIRPVAEEVLPAILHALKDKAPEARMGAAQSLGFLGPLTPDVVPALVNALEKDAHPWVRAGAAEGLGRIDASTSDVVEGLVKALENDDELHVQAAAGRALGQLTPVTSDAMGALVKALKDAPDDVRGAIIESLGGNTTVPAVVDVLINTLTYDETNHVRVYAVQSLAQTTPVRPKVAGVLVNALKSDSDTRVRSIAAEALGRADPATQSIIAALIAAQNDDEDRYVQLQASKALERIQSPRRPRGFLPHLKE